MLEHSWPLHERSKRFELGLVLNSAVVDLIPPPQVGDIGIHHTGCWECDLADHSLIWSGGVYDLFGLRRSITVSRDDAVALYCESSRAAMESLRAYAIKQQRGFTIDVEIKSAMGQGRWMRLIAAPVIQDGKVTKLHGLKIAL